ncbi:helix-turn-helix transcriptional regulator [Kineosporia sp. NBRC 101731]|uniref:helix-turn-helix domain-containing protein n=1 Tax=Kineosporia sp. NBRC 101731 TaxID=3032199 RepID=UPI00255535EE|nr:helix-turn-helix transcriptional regulator [Kineosporia sp. NBRC 101731]
MPNNPLVSKVELASTLRQLRLEAGKTLEDAADVLEVSTATISRIETGGRIPRARDVRELCRYYGLQNDDRIAELAALVAGARASGWWEEYEVIDEKYGTFIGYEEAATRIEQFENTTMPALLQTRSYAWHYFRDVVRLYWKSIPTDRQNNERIDVRELRRSHLTARAGSVDYSVILDEAVLMRIVGSVAVMREQIQWLISAAQESWVSVYVLPMDKGAVAGPVGPFTALTLPQDGVTDVVYTDTLRGQDFNLNKSEVDLHKRVLAHLRAEALDASESIQLLTARLAAYQA